jgi:carbon monoxide dehydrogenase subunit G
MELNHDFRVGIPVKDAWKVLTDVERIAPHLPGAQLQEVEGDEYRGIVKVKVGPITAQYKGAATFLEQDESAGRVVLRAAGRDTRGQGNANATITATMQADGDGTKVKVKTDLTVTGKVAQFGRGVMADVSSKLLGQFVDALEKDLEQSGTSGGGPGDAAAAGAAATGSESPAAGAPGSEAPAAGPAGSTGSSGTAAPASPASPASASPSPSSSTTGGPEPGGGPATTVATAGTPVQESSTNGAAAGAPAAAAPGAPEAFSAPTASPGVEPAPAAPAPAEAPKVRKIEGPEAKPVDLIDAAGGSVAKRLLPLLGVAAIVALLVWLRRRK